MNISLYIITIALLLFSFFKDRKKTAKALIKGWTSLENILPQFLGIIILVGLLLSIFDAELISRFIGAESGWMGTVLSALVGAVTLVPGFIAFPTAALLLEGGAGITQIGAFVSALMMVGIVTIPVETKYFGRRLTLTRNLLAFCFTFIVANVISLTAGVFL